MSTPIEKGELFLLSIGLVAAGKFELQRARGSPPGEDLLDFGLVMLVILSALGWLAVVARTAAKGSLGPYAWIAYVPGIADLLVATLLVAGCVLVGEAASDVDPNKQR